MSRPRNLETALRARRALALMALHTRRALALMALRARRALALALVLALLAPGALALPGDREQPIRIESDRAQRDGQRGVTVYEGDVELRQGSLHIQADRLTIHTDADNRVQRVEAQGAPARFEQQPEPDKPPVHARAQRIDYHADSDLLELIDNARLEQGEASMAGDRIDYNIASEQLQAEGDDDSPRIEIVLPPQSERGKED